MLPKYGHQDWMQDTTGYTTTQYKGNIIFLFLYDISG